MRGDEEMKVCKEYDNKTGKCAKDSENPCPVGGDEDKCELEIAVFGEEVEEPEETEETEGDPTIAIVKRVIELVKEDTPLKNAFVGLIDAQTKRILAEAAWWRSALALKHTRNPVEEQD